MIVVFYTVQHFTQKTFIWSSILSLSVAAVSHRMNLAATNLLESVNSFSQAENNILEFLCRAFLPRILLFYS